MRVWAEAVEAARRVGIRVVRTQVWLYVLVGALAAFGGVPSVWKSASTWSCSTSRRKPASNRHMAWSATSSMKVSGTLVTGMPRAVAAFTSTESTPTLASAMTRHFSSESMIPLVMGTPLA